MLTCHWYVTPLPVAVTEKDADAPVQAVASAGCAVIVAGELTVSVAAFDVALDGQALFTNTRY